MGTGGILDWSVSDKVQACRSGVLFVLFGGSIQAVYNQDQLTTVHLQV